MRVPVRQLPKILFICSASLFLSCDQSFDPRPSGSSSPIVYSILATDKPDQYVRVLSTYPPSISTPTSNTVEYPITDAVVTIRRGGIVHPLVLTMLPRRDSSRYKSPIYAYRTTGFNLQYGATYTLEVLLPSSGILSSTITIPSKPMVTMAGGPVLKEPQAFDPRQRMEMSATITGGAEGFLFRLLVCYDVLENGLWVRKQTEIPSRFSGEPHTLASALYGEVTKVQSPYVVNVYTSDVYRAVLNDIYERTQPYKLVFNYVVLQFVQLDRNFYNYYMSVKGFQDPFSIRLDQSQYSNIKNGTGIFAGCSVDSLVQILPAEFQHNRW